jgi:hypothetical protein
MKKASCLLAGKDSFIRKVEDTHKESIDYHAALPTDSRFTRNECPNE